MTFNVGDAVMLNLDYLLITKNGEVNGLEIDNVSKIKQTTIKKINEYERYPVITQEEIGGTSRFLHNELIKIENK
jgi:hypothetical protein